MSGGGTVRVLWDSDDSAVVNIYGPTGAVASGFKVGGNGVTFPYTLTSSTSFVTTLDDRYSVSVKVSGVEIADTPDGPRTANLYQGAELVFAPSPDDRDSVGGGANLEAVRSVIAGDVADPATTIGASLKSAYAGLVSGLGSDPSANVAAIQSALDAGHALLPPGGEYEINATLTLPSNATLDLNGGRLFSTTDKINLIASIGTTAPVVRNGRIEGNGTGSQPANVANPTLASLANSGCGIIFAGVTRGLVENVTVTNCAGDMSDSDHNGVAGVWFTYSCQDTKAVACHAISCRNGFNEDNFFQPATGPSGNQFIGCIADGCVFGGANDNGGTGRGAAFIGGVYKNCAQNGIEFHNAPHSKASGVTCTGNAQWGLRSYGSSDFVHIGTDCDFAGNTQSKGLSIESGSNNETLPTSWQTAGIWSPKAQVGFDPLAQNSGAFFGGYRRNSGTQNDYIEWAFNVLSGTYRLELAMSTGADQGIYTVTVDGVQVGTIDGYAASASNAVGNVSGIALSNGRHVIRFTMATKNAASSSYKGQVAGVSLIRTSN